MEVGQEDEEDQEVEEDEEEDGSMMMTPRRSRKVKQFKLAADVGKSSSQELSGKLQNPWPEKQACRCSVAFGVSCFCDAFHGLA